MTLYAHDIVCTQISNWYKHQYLKGHLMVKKAKPHVALIK